MSKFISLEGGEGAGKSTLLKRLAVALGHRGLEVVVTREPGATDLGADIRRWLLDEKSLLDPRSELFLFLADRAQHVKEVIHPALKRGAVVLSDRFYDSTIAYQGAARQFDLATIEQMCLFATAHLKPDLTLLLDLDPHKGLERAGKRKALDRLEQEGMAFHMRVREGFLALAQREKERFAVLDASASAEAVFETAWKIVDGLLK